MIWYKMLSLTLLLCLILAVTGCSFTSSTPATNQPSVTNQTSANKIVADATNAYFTNIPSDSYKISEKDFLDKVKANESMFIMDIRTAEDYEKGHIKGSVNIPWGASIAQNLSNLPKDKAIMVYCYTGQTASQTVALLNVAGFNAKAVNLGWNLGISKVVDLKWEKKPGTCSNVGVSKVESVVDGVTETTTNAVPEAKTKIEPEIKVAISSYFTKMVELNGTTYANYKISEDDAKKAVEAKDSGVMFLDVRSAADFAEGHISGAINIPFAKGMQESFGQLPKDKKIIVYCYTGQTAGQTIAILRLLGYDAVSLNSGMGTSVTSGSGWANKGFPVVQ